jgi:hypothetical protein
MACVPSLAKVNGSMIPARAGNGDIGTGKSTKFEDFLGLAHRNMPNFDDFS